MGRVAKMKNRTLSSRSRTARRAASPPVDITSSKNGMKDVPHADVTASVLQPQHNGNISKKKRQKPLKREQRLRKERGAARAHAFSDQLQLKIARSKGKAKSIKDRSADWDDLNMEVSKRKTKKNASLPNTQQGQTAAMQDIVLPEEDMKDVGRVFGIVSQPDSSLPIITKEQNERREPDDVDEIT